MPDPSCEMVTLVTPVTLFCGAQRCRARATGRPVTARAGQPTWWAPTAAGVCLPDRRAYTRAPA
jgi:hypothetical protein